MSFMMAKNLSPILVQSPQPILSLRLVLFSALFDRPLRIGRRWEEEFRASPPRIVGVGRGKMPLESNGAGINSRRTFRTFWILKR